MFDDSRYEYTVKLCPSDDPEALELLLNQMSEDDWELYMLHEIDSGSKGLQYNCIFYREAEEDEALDSGEIVDVSNFKTRMEKMLNPYDEPYEECKEIQRQIIDRQDKINKIKSLLDSDPDNAEHKKLNEEISKNYKELGDLKNTLSEIIDPIRMYNRINQEKLTIVISDELLELVDNAQGELISETVKLRQKLVDKLGYVIPNIRFTNSETLEANEYRIDIRGFKALSGIIYPEYLRLYFGQSNLTRKPKDAIEDIDPVNGQRVIWVEKSKAKDYWEQGLTPAQVICQHLEYIVTKHADEILDYNDISNYMELVSAQNTFLIENLIPEFLSIGEVRYIFAKLINERVSVKDLLYIFERLNDIAENEDDKNAVLEKLRISLSRQICNSIADSGNNIYGITISDDLASSIEEDLIEENDGFIIDIHNQKINKLIKRITTDIKESEYDIINTAIITPTSIRPEIFKLFEQIIPGLSVISQQELSRDFNIEIIDNIDF